jgi:hypothetical protein
MALRFLSLPRNLATEDLTQLFSFEESTTNAIWHQSKHACDQKKQAKLYSLVGIPCRVCLGRREFTSESLLKYLHGAEHMAWCRPLKVSFNSLKVGANHFLFLRKVSLMLDASFPSWQAFNRNVQSVILKDCMPTLLCVPFYEKFELNNLSDNPVELSYCLCLRYARSRSDRGSNWMQGSI